MMVTGVLGVVAAIMALLPMIDSGYLEEKLGEITVTTAVVIALAAICSFVSTALSFFVGLRLIKGRRGAASALINVNIAVTIVALVCEFMLYGIGWQLLFNFAQIAVQVALSAYLNPSLANESKLQSGLRKLDTQVHAESGTLGLADPGEGYIRLDFFNLFWTFMVGSVVGLIVEIIFHMIVVEPGVYQDRAGLLWGPFSPIYGIGAVLMTIALNRFKDRNILFIFVVCTIIGGGFEYFVSWFMEVAFGATAWDYSNEFLGDLFGGRTCLLFASMFGILGTVWIKLLLPYSCGSSTSSPGNGVTAGVDQIGPVLLQLSHIKPSAGTDCREPLFEPLVERVDHVRAGDLPFLQSPHAVTDDGEDNFTIIYHGMEQQHGILIGGLFDADISIKT